MGQEIMVDSLSSKDIRNQTLSSSLNLLQPSPLPSGKRLHNYGKS